MGNVISSIQGSSRLGWWHSAAHRKVILDASEDLSRNPVAPSANSGHGDVKYIESDRRTESDSESENKAPVRNISRTLSPEKAAELEEFRRQLALKREARKKLIASKSDEMETLRENLNEERRLREELTAENTELRALIARNNIADPEANVSERQENNRLTCAVAELEERVRLLKERSRAARMELGEANHALQSANAETALFEKENFELKKAITALKEVKKVSKEMLDIRETQLAQLKEKLSDIEKSLADREMRTMSDELKREYERQLENIRNLRILYEERARMSEVTRLSLLREVDEHKSIAESRTKKCEELEARVEELEKQLSDKDDVLVTTESQLGFSKAETSGLQAEMTVINQLFSQMLLGYNSNQDLDKLLLKLEENHDLLTDMVVREDCSEMASALPKLILDLINQIDASETSADTDDVELENKEISNSEEAIASSSKSLTSAKEIVGNLPKVWRVLTELLSHQSGPPLVVSEISEKSSINCYKSVETPSGPRMVPSVSKTYIRLKDLILEKKSLQKEMNRLKQLNSHLENRLQDQGRRLGLVSSELSKTWHVVGRMERQHQQLHTHEKILRYELQQKRKLLTELKEELEFCKDKWDRAKQKNSESQIEWDKLRVEFASRKIKSTESVSAESGYSDERASDEDSDASEDKKSERRRLKRKAKSPDINAGDKTLCATITQEERVDSDVPQDEELPNDSIDTISDNEIQANLADTEDQSVSETPPINEPISEEDTSNSQDEIVVASSSSTQNNATCYDNVLATRSARLKKLEEQCYVLVNKVTKTNNKGIQLCNRLEELHNQYGGPDQPSTSNQTVTEVNEDISNDRLVQDSIDGKIVEEDRTPALTENTEISAKDTNHSCTDTEIHSKESVTDSSEHQQDEIFTVETVNDLKEDCIENNPCQNESQMNEEIKDNAEIKDSSEPGKSCISEYESRFAARDERLKRLEEQAKSLVNKVSNTSTRSVEICSKLDELHNTYGRSEDKQKDNSTDITSEIRPSTSGVMDAQQMPDTVETETQGSSINSSLEQRNNERE